MDGIIILDKESGMFSRTAGYKVSKIFSEKKFGHIGTLDPMATGVLPIVLGNATKMIPFIEDFVDPKKEYLFSLKFGISTNTLDITGETINKSSYVPTEEEIVKACDKLIGEQDQIPPIFSAIHVNGVRAYEKARKGETIELKPRKINIYELEYLNKIDDIFNFRVLCSRGTYVRSIVRDIANLCGTLATTTAIRRTLTTGFTTKNAVKLDFLEKLVNNNTDVSKYLLASDCALGDIPVINLSDKDTIFYKNGRFIDITAKNGLYRVYNNNVLIGIGKIEENVLKPKRTI